MFRIWYYEEIDVSRTRDHYNREKLLSSPNAKTPWSFNFGHFIIFICIFFYHSLFQKCLCYVFFLTENIIILYIIFYIILYIILS